MRHWQRRAGMALLGIVLIGWAVSAPGGVAGAANYEIETNAALTFVTTGGDTVTCTVINHTLHSTDNAAQPYTWVASGESGPSGVCFDLVRITVTINYKDKSGVARIGTVEGFATGTTKITGTYSPITTSVRADYLSCDTDRSAMCVVTAQAAPK